MSLSFEILKSLIGLTAPGASELAQLVYRYLREKLDAREPLPATVAAPTDAVRVGEVLREQEERIGSAAATDITTEVIEAAYGHLNGIREERLRQARMSFNAALTLAVVGIVIILAGVVLLLRGDVTAGVISSGAGVVSEALSAILFRLNKETNDRLDQVGREMQTLERARFGMRYIEKISDASTKDAAIRELARELHSGTMSTVRNAELGLSADEPRTGAA